MWNTGQKKRSVTSKNAGEEVALGCRSYNSEKSTWMNKKSFHLSVRLVTKLKLFLRYVLFIYQRAKYGTV